MNRIVMAVLMGLALWAPTANASEAEDDPNTGPYLGLGFTVGFNNFDDSFTAPFPDVRVTGGIDGVLGWRLHHYVALEAEVEWAGVPGFKSEDLTLEPELVVKPVVTTGNVKVFPIRGVFQPFVLVGAGMMSADVSVDDESEDIDESDRQNGAAMRFGAGIDYYITERLVLNIQANYILPFGDAEDFDYFNVEVFGLEYHF